MGEGERQKERVKESEQGKGEKAIGRKRERTRWKWRLTFSECATFDRCNRIRIHRCTPRCICAYGRGTRCARPCLTSRRCCSHSCPSSRRNSRTRSPRASAACTTTREKRAPRCPCLLIDAGLRCRNSPEIFGRCPCNA